MSEGNNFEKVSLVTIFGLEKTLSIKDIEQVTRIRKKIERIIENEFNKANLCHVNGISKHSESVKNKELVKDERWKFFKIEAMNCGIIFSLTTINYLFLRNNKTLFNNIYTNHIFKPAFIFTFLMLPNAISLYFMKLNYELIKHKM